METIKRNAQYTYKYNKELGRHGWLRLTPAYSVHMVETILNSLDSKPQCVLEPFSGTGTTELVCANQGILSFGYEINPFLTWFSSVKTSVYSPDIIDLFFLEVDGILDKVSCINESEYPKIYNIERWWHKKQLSFLARIKSAILIVENEKVRDLLNVVFCRLIIELSNASFNHVSTSFSDAEDDGSFNDEYGKVVFLSLCNMVGETAKENPIEETHIVNGSSLTFEDNNHFFDTVITSPPYPNRISYIRELRPYMYWLDYLFTSDDASNLDWNTVGGTWGSATSRLSSWKPKSIILPDYVYDIAKSISCAKNKSAVLLSKYVLKYFEDIAIHMQSVSNAISTNGSVHYIVGNSYFYGIEVPSDKIYKDLLSQFDFCNAKSLTIRKRNCNKGLYEYWISANK